MPSSGLITAIPRPTLAKRRLRYARKSMIRTCSLLTTPPATNGPPTCSPLTTATGMNWSFRSASFFSTRPPVLPPAPEENREGHVGTQGGEAAASSALPCYPAPAQKQRRKGLEWTDGHQHQGRYEGHPPSPRHMQLAAPRLQYCITCRYTVYTTTHALRSCSTLGLDGTRPQTTTQSSA